MASQIFENQSQELFITKGVFIFVVLLESFVFGILPLKVRRFRQSETVLSVANAFSGGVFLAIAFVHIIPETARLYYQYQLALEEKAPVKIEGRMSGIDSLIQMAQSGASRQELQQKTFETIFEIIYHTFPLPFALVLLGYTFILMIDRVLIGHSHDSATSKQSSSIVEGADLTPAERKITFDNDDVETEKANPFRETIDSGQIQYSPNQVSGRMQVLVLDGKDVRFSIQSSEDNRDDHASIEFRMEEEEEASKWKVQKLSSDALIVHQSLHTQFSDRRKISAEEGQLGRQKSKVHINESQLRLQFRQLVSKNDLFSVSMFEHMTKQRQRAEVAKLRRDRNKKLFQTHTSIEGANKLDTKDCRARRHSADAKDLIKGLSALSEDREQPLVEDEADQQYKVADVEPAKERYCTSEGCQTYLNAMVLLIALSTHAVFEGIALGLTNELSATINIMLGLLFHKGPAAMSLGIALSKRFQGETRKAILLLLLFALATPIGIALGLAISTSNNMLEIVFNSFAGGTFVYIAASEVVVEEFSLTERRWMKMLFFVIGGAIITSMWVIE